jgi:hypothetical protein
VPPSSCNLPWAKDASVYQNGTIQLCKKFSTKTQQVTTVHAKKRNLGKEKRWLHCQNDKFRKNVEGRGQSSGTIQNSAFCKILAELRCRRHYYFHAFLPRNCFSAVLRPIFLLPVLLMIARLAPRAIHLLFSFCLLLVPPVLITSRLRTQC